MFAARLAACGRALAPHVEWELDDVLAGRHGFEAADVVQPALWAVMVSLAAVWQAAGVVPDAVVGHSQGEIAAAVVAGILSLEDAARVVALRSRTLKALAGRGGMLSVAESADGVRERIASFGERLAVAAVNGPGSTVVSGEPDALRELAESCPESVRTRLIPVDYASHSAHVDELREEILSVLAGISPQAARVPMISAMSGEMLAGPELDAAYWYASLRETVEFERGIRTLGGNGHGVFVEVSPHPVLAGAIGDTVDDDAAVVVGTLRRDEGGAGRLLASLAEAFVRGVPVEWAAVVERGQTVELPTYAFQHRRYWPGANVPGGAGEAVGGRDSGADAEFWAAVESGDLSGLAGTLEYADSRLAEVLPVLADYRRRSLVDSEVADWRYRIDWVPVEVPGVVTLTGTWLLVVGDAAGADAGVVARALSERGAEVVTVDPARLGEVSAEGVVGVVSLLALDEAPLGGFAGVSVGVAGTLGLVQGLGEVGVVAPLWVLTRGAVGTGPGEGVCSPVQAQVWGLGRVAGLELPERWGGLVDLPEVFDERAAGRLAGVLAGVGGEDQVALRVRGVLGRRLVRAGRVRRGGGWVPRGTVLVTGGTGGIGGYTASWLAGRGARRVVLTSRSGPAAGGVAALAAGVAGAGSAVDVVACDIADRGQVACLLGRIDAGGPGLSSVVHAAGVGCKRPVGELSVGELAGAFGGKVGGAVVLDELTAGCDLDAFVMFSSGAGVWGSGGLSGYAAGNAFLDALCEQRRARGLVGSSVAWGLWAGVGMADGAEGERLREFGMRVIDAERGMRALGQVLDGGEGVVAVAGIDWERFAPTFTLRRSSPLIASLPEVRQLSAAERAEARTRRPS